MTWDRVAVVERQLDHFLETAEPAAHRLEPRAPLHASTDLTAAAALGLLEDQLASRQVDVAARELKKTQRSYYTISSAGHENNAVIGARLRMDDPAFLHYRSGGFFMARARQLLAGTPTFDTLLGIVASSDDPIAQGRHKVWGSRDMWIPPQTSTIASHLPKAMGLAFSLARAKRIGVGIGLPADAIAVCSFGDASANHATALAAINTARYAVRRGLPMPLLLVCEDNDTGISVPTPEGWIASTFGGLPHLEYFSADGELDEIWATVGAAIDHVRSRRQPAFLHLRTVRLWGHAGSDAEQTYRSLAEIEGVEALDPVLRNARRLVELGAATPDELRDLVRETRGRVAALAEEAAGRPRLQTTEEVIAPLAPSHPERVKIHARTPLATERERAESFGATLPERATGPTSRTLAASLNATLADELLRRPELLLFGQDIGRKGGVYNVTHGLQKRFGPARVFDTLLDETSILGIAQGGGHIGLLPIPEIQYLAYLHNALDQVRGEAATLQFFSSGQFRNPMVIRVPGLAYQKGFGGHFHNDNSVGALRDIPGVVLATPSRGDDAARMLRGAISMAAEDGRVVIFLEPIALYHEKDLHAEGDNGWLTDYPKPPAVLLPGEVGIYDTTDGDPDLLLISYANGLRLSLQAAKRLADDHGLRARVLDLRWLNPLPTEAIRAHAAEVGSVVVIDECRATGGGVADAIVADLAEQRIGRRYGSVRAVDSFVPLGPATAAVLVGVDQIVAASAAAARRSRQTAARRRRAAAARS
ncbi:MAG TPA: thiamine pyrophosphate-dependent enzyme [Candidatus Binatia bacterium]|nr:thiamine pyrophosphate-dependent enzyme [Candidatus Binatia bacterium]